jgi:hypothetical protein
MKNSSTIRFYFFLATMLCGMVCFARTQTPDTETPDTQQTPDTQRIFKIKGIDL